MQILDTLHEMPNPVFWKNKKKYFNISSAENFTQSAKRYNEVKTKKCVFRNILEKNR